MVVAYHGESKAIKPPKCTLRMAWNDNKYKSMFKYIDLQWIIYWSVQWAEYFKANNSQFKTKEGVLFSSDGLEIIQYTANKKQDKYVIPDGIEIIGNSAFNSGYNLKTIVISADVKSIRNNAFSSNYLNI